METVRHLTWISIKTFTCFFLLDLDLQYLEAHGLILFPPSAPPPLRHSQQQMIIISLVAKTLSSTYRLQNPQPLSPKQFFPQMPQSVTSWTTWTNILNINFKVSRTELTPVGEPHHQPTNFLSPETFK